METMLVKGKTIPKFDNALIVFLGLDKVDTITDRSANQLGIENGDGEVYRIVGAENDLIYSQLINRLRELRYRIEPLQGNPFGRFKAIVRTPPKL
jgi:hypothetical protein